MNEDPKSNGKSPYRVYFSEEKQIMVITYDRREELYRPHHYCSYYSRHFKIFDYLRLGVARKLLNFDL